MLYGKYPFDAKEARFARKIVTADYKLLPVSHPLHTYRRIRMCDKHSVVLLQKAGIMPAQCFVGNDLRSLIFLTCFLRSRRMQACISAASLHLLVEKDSVAL